MAIYNWRYVDSDWYSSATERNMATGWAEFWVRTPGGTVSNTARPTVVTQPDNSKPSFNESMWVNSNQTSPTFSNAEVFWLQSQWYRNLGDNAMANAYGSLANNLWNYSRFANNTLQGYDSMLNFIRWNEEWLQRTAWNLYNQLSRDIQDSRDYVNRMFGPNGELTREVNTYYDDLGNYLSTEAWRQAANIAAQWVHSWASLWAIRAQQNQAYNEAFGRYVQAKEQQINAKQQLAANLINYMSTLRQEYWDTTNQYVIDLYKRANDMYNSIAQSAAADLNQYNTLLASRSWSWGWSASWVWSSVVVPSSSSSGQSNDNSNNSWPTSVTLYDAITNADKWDWGTLWNIQDLRWGALWWFEQDMAKYANRQVLKNSSIPSNIQNIIKPVLRGAGLL